MVGHTGSPIRITHTDVTLTWSKVKVIDLLKFQKLHFSTSTLSAILAWRSQLMGDDDSMGPSLQLFRARFLNFSPSCQSRDFEVRETLILLSSNISSRCPLNIVNFGPLMAQIDPVVWGIPANFNGFRVLAALLHGTPRSGGSQPNFAALNRVRHLCLAGRPSRWALAHILV